MSEILYQINPTLRIQRFDEAAVVPRWLYELDDPAGRVQRLVVSSAMHRLLGAFESPRPLAWSGQDLLRGGWSDADAPMLRKLLDERCLPARLLIAQGELSDESRQAPVQARRPGYMSLMLPVLGVSAVGRLASRLQKVFHPWVMVPAVIVIVVAMVALMAALSRDGQFAALGSRDVLMAIGLGGLGVLLHELGHAAAAWRCGARSVSIGVGWYVCFPVAYAELSETWRMTRRQRVLIDVAGIHMQGLWVATLMTWHAASGEAVLLVAALSSALSILWNMNPLLRMDGYWLLSDLLGIPNLREAAKASLADFVRRRRGRAEHASASRFGPRTTAFVLVYGALSIVFFAWMIVAACRYFGDAALHAIPALAQRLWSSEWSQMGAADRGLLLGGLCWQLLMVVVLGRFLLMTLMRGWRNRSMPMRTA